MNLRIVTPGGVPPSTIDHAEAHAALDRILAAKPVVIAILAEFPKNYDWEAIPRAQSVARGLMEDCLDAMLYAKDGGDE